MVKRTFVIAMVIAMTWSGIRLLSVLSATSKDWRGLGLYIGPFMFVIKACITLFLLWPPLLGLGLAIGHRKMTQSEIRAAGLVLLTSLPLFAFAVWYTFYLPTMNR
jgi:hypothetical protein